MLLASPLPSLLRFTQFMADQACKGVDLSFRGTLPLLSPSPWQSEPAEGQVSVVIMSEMLPPLSSLGGHQKSFCRCDCTSGTTFRPLIYTEMVEFILLSGLVPTPCSLHTYFNAVREAIYYWMSGQLCTACSALLPLQVPFQIDAY